MLLINMELHFDLNVSGCVPQHQWYMWNEHIKTNAASTPVAWEYKHNQKSNMNIKYVCVPVHYTCSDIHFIGNSTGSIGRAQQFKHHSVKSSIIKYLILLFHLFFFISFLSLVFIWQGKHSHALKAYRTPHNLMPLWLVYGAYDFRTTSQSKKKSYGYVKNESNFHRSCH